MFVIVQCWYNLPQTEIQGKPLHERIGLTLQVYLKRTLVQNMLNEIFFYIFKHAGVAITVTSMTDVFAFGIGAVTVLI